MKKWYWSGAILLLVLAGAWQFRMPMYLLIAQPQMFTGPVFDREPPPVPALTGERNVLVLTKTNGFRHDSIPDAVRLIQDISGQHGWGLFHTENAAVFNPEDLARFDLVVLASSSGPLFTEEQETAFKDFIESGGGAVAMHAAGDSSHESEWYLSELICTTMVGHPMRQQFQSATLNVEDRNHPATRHLEDRWTRTDEWYNFAVSPRPKVNVLISIDESSYDPEDRPMGDDHPMVWSRMIGNGRVLYSALGHSSESYAEPEHRQLIEGAMVWAATAHQL